MASFDLLAGPAAVRAKTGSKNVYAAVPDRAFFVDAEIRAKPGKEAEPRAAALPLIDLVRGDPNNLASSKRTGLRRITPSSSKSSQARRMSRRTMRSPTSAPGSPSCLTSPSAAFRP
jgi:hypothetical protein